MQNNPKSESGEVSAEPKLESQQQQPQKRFFRTTIDALKGALKRVRTPLGEEKVPAYEQKAQVEDLEQRFRYLPEPPISQEVKPGGTQIIRETSHGIETIPSSRVEPTPLPRDMNQRVEEILTSVQEKGDEEIEEKFEDTSDQLRQTDESSNR